MGVGGGGAGAGAGGGQHIQAIRKTNSSKREATLKPSSECSFVCTTTASIWSQLPLNLCSHPPSVNGGILPAVWGYWGQYWPEAFGGGLPGAIFPQS